MTWKKRKHLFEFRYKSGHVVMVHADELSVKRNVVTGEITEMTWDNMYPKGMYVNLGDIESIWQV